MWKRSNRKDRRVKRTRFKFIKFFLPFLILVLLFASYLLINSNFFSIKKIDLDVKNIACVSGDELKDALNLSGQNLIFLNLSKIEKELKEKFVCIKNVEILRIPPNKIKLNVFGREPVVSLISLGSYEASGSSIIEKFSEPIASDSAEASPSAFIDHSDETISDIFLVDDEGIIFAKNENFPKIPKLFVYEQNLSLGKEVSQDLIKNSLLIFNRLKIFGISIKEAKIYSIAFLLVDAAPRIIFKLDDKIDIQLASLQLILNQAKISQENIEFIDLRFDKPIIRFAPKKKNNG